MVGAHGHLYCQGTIHLWVHMDTSIVKVHLIHFVGAHGYLYCQALQGAPMVHMGHFYFKVGRMMTLLCNETLAHLARPLLLGLGMTSFWGLF